MYHRFISIAFVVLFFLFVSNAEANDTLLQGHILHKEKPSSKSSSFVLPNKLKGDAFLKLGDPVNQIAIFETTASKEEEGVSQDLFKRFELPPLQKIAPVSAYVSREAPRPKDIYKVNKTVQEFKQPYWIQGRVYTNSKMTMYTCRNYTFFKKDFKYEIPLDSPSTLEIKPEIVSYWRGFRPWKCFITCEPYGPRGNFRFYHSRADGPRGYLQYIGKDENGFSNYRYWFQQ